MDEQPRLKVEYVAAENRFLRSQIRGSPRSPTSGIQAGKKLGKKVLEEIASIATPEPILRWHRDLVARKFDT